MKSIFASTLVAVLVCAGLCDFVTSKEGLQVDVYHQAPASVVYQNSTELSFSPTAFALIHGKHDAVLIDAPATIAQGHALADWIHRIIPGKQLKKIYITHGHGDQASFGGSRFAVPTGERWCEVQPERLSAAWSQGQMNTCP